MIDGEILATETRELKSGKILAMFNLFDGSSTITCKVFLEAEKSKAILKRMNSAKGVKVIGTAQFEPICKRTRGYCKCYCRKYWNKKRSKTRQFSRKKE